MSPAEHAAAERLFLYACGVGSPEDWTGREDELRKTSAPQWIAVRDHASEHGFAGLLARYLSWAAEAAAIDLPVVGELEKQRRGQLVQHLARKGAARRVGVALHERGIPFIVFKGIVLAEEIYGDLSVRGFRDIDIMVPEADLDSAYAACVKLGYRLSTLPTLRDFVAAGAHAAGMEHADGSGVDLHWSIAPDVLDPARVARIWQHTRAAPAGATLAGLRLGPEMTLVHLAKHLHAHEYVSPKPLVDFFVAARVLTPELDGGKLQRLASELGLLPVLDSAAALSDRCFIPGALPAAVRARTHSRAARIARRVVDEGLLVDAARQPRISNWSRYLLAAGDARAVGRGVAKILFPSRLTLAQFFRRPYAPGLYPLYYWRQLVKVITLSPK
jgi:hypothetical protein